MQIISGPHRFPGGYYHLLAYRGEPWAVELRLPHLAAQISLLKEEGLTVSLLSPCCARDLGFGALGSRAVEGDWSSPARCSYCGREALFRTVDIWWQYGSIDTLQERLAEYYETWGLLNVLGADIQAGPDSEMIRSLEPSLAVLRGRASAWPPRSPVIA